jgi:hypothetical protein
MKVRILGNSIRFRLKKSEVSKLSEKEEVREVICFGISAANHLSFILKCSQNDNFQLSFDGNSIVVQIPDSVGAEWTSTELVGFEEHIETDEGAVVDVLVEKDFKCLDRSDIEDEDAYPNPNLHC